jgi:hypothetical protein
VDCIVLVCSRQDEWTVGHQNTKVSDLSLDTPYEVRSISRSAPGSGSFRPHIISSLAQIRRLGMSGLQPEPGGLTNDLGGYLGRCGGGSTSPST